MSKIIKKPQAVANLESTLVRTVRARGGVSRAELARELELVASTAGIYVDRLIERGYLVESPTTKRTLGRPGVRIELNPAGGRFVGVDFNAQQIMAVAVDFAQRPLEQICRKIPARATVERVLATIEDALAEVIGSRRSDVLGIGLGVPGPIDPERGVSLHYDFIRDWHDVAIGPRIAARFAVPVFVENNLRSMALGELWCGIGRGLRNLVCLGIRSGIGTGVIVDGRLLRGAKNLAGEIGHWIVPSSLSMPRGSDTQRSRTIEQVASLTAILNEAATRLARGQRSLLGQRGSRPTIADLLAAADEGDKLALALVAEAASVHGWIAHQLSLLLDPERIILAGPLVECETYFQAVVAAAVELSGPTLAPGVAGKIARSNLGPYAGALGAAALAFHQWKPRR